jgi:superfamily II DNA or RNA helicase
MNSVDPLASLPKGRTEYFRNAVAVIPLSNDPDPGLAMMVIEKNKKKLTLNCNCRVYRKKGHCKHSKEMAKAFRQLGDPPEKGTLEASFSQGHLQRLAKVLHDACPVETRKLVIETDNPNPDETQQIRVCRSNGDLLVTCFIDGGTVGTSSPDEGELLAQRTGLIQSDGDPYHRGRILNMLSLMTMTDTERALHEMGLKSRRQVFEESFWYRLAYHFQNVYGSNGTPISAEIEQSTGRFLIRSHGIEIVVPRQEMMRVGRALAGDFENPCEFKIWPESLESIVKVTADESNNLNVVLYLLLHLPDGSTEAIERQKLRQFWYNDTVYIPEKEVFATWRKPDKFRDKFGGKYSKKIKQKRLPEVIENIGDIFAPPNMVDPSVNRLQIYREYSRVEIDTHAVDRDWCWLSFRYGFGENAFVSLKDIYDARMSGKRFFPVHDGWVDLDAIKIETLVGSLGNTIRSQLAGSEQKLRLSRMDLLRFQAGSDKPFQIAEETQPDSGLIRSILEICPPEPVTGFESHTSPLRAYQRSGVDWLAFLYENRFGGLLCDEMGLGKTHQIMALMVWLSKVKKELLPFIVVCPTTVISHWSRKIREHASVLLPLVYHGTDRELEKIETPGTVLITSYGILLRDINQLARLSFSMAVFDEAQYIKNPETKSYSSAVTLEASLKIAVTGTPVENRLGDLKALMDLVLPGYLGSDNAFQLGYELGEKRQRERLRKLVSPFALRRTKAVVLSELPEKIEDIRYCRLTDTQVSLYRQAISSRGKGLLKSLQSGDDDIPYIHIFALLTLLKQICNHPASIPHSEAATGDQPLDSGKWELFVELVDTCLENGLKIVVFSQFVKMIDIIVNYLENRGIVTAGITGKTRKRGQQIDRFNNDQECRVFVGSLKAGGSGIDLTGGSVVIHYDRWWNAAKEDQATDRVHRIGQTRGVQVFKLVTEGTLEEKISAIIAKKKKLMRDVIAEDDPGLIKSFSREDLIDLIKMPD